MLYFADKNKLHLTTDNIWTFWTLETASIVAEYVRCYAI